MRRTESHLFGFSEKIVRPAIQYHTADNHQGHELLRNQFGCVQMIERESVCILLREKLHREFPFGEFPSRNRLEHIASMKILIRAGNFHGLIPDGGLQTELGAPVKFDESGFTGGINQAKTMHAKAFDHA